MPSFPARSTQLRTAATSTPGVGTTEPSRKIALMPSVNSNFWRRAGARKACANTLSTSGPPAIPASRGVPAQWSVSQLTDVNTTGTPTSPRRSPSETDRKRIGKIVVAHRHRSKLQPSGRAAGCRDLLFRALRERMGVHLKRNRDITGAEDLDLLATAHSALRHEVLDRDLAAVGVQRGELVEVHHLVLDPERVLEPLELRQAHVQRKLPALEVGGNLVPSLGALGTAPGRLTLRRLASAHPRLRGLGAGSRPQVMRLQRRVAHRWSLSCTVSLLASAAEIASTETR